MELCQDSGESHEPVESEENNIRRQKNELIEIQKEELHEKSFSLAE
jgi:hypothetical protein